MHLIRKLDLKIDFDFFFSRVMCFHPRSDLSLPLMNLKDIQQVIQEWITQYDELSKKYQWVQVYLLN